MNLYYDRRICVSLIKFLNNRGVLHGWEISFNSFITFMLKLLLPQIYKKKAKYEQYYEVDADYYKVTFIVDAF